MTSKRPLEAAMDEELNAKRNRTENSDDDLITDAAGNEISTMEKEGNPAHRRNVVNSEHFDDQVKNEPCEVKDEPLLCDVPHELCDVDPLRPVGKASEVENERTDDIVKTECDPTSPEAKSSVYDDDLKLEVHEATVPDDSETPELSSDLPARDELDAPNKSEFVKLLVETHFLQNNRTSMQENILIQAGRPTPLMGKFQDPSGSAQGFWATKKEYELIPWLTGLEKDSKYFCWPCLLFTTDRWSFQGGKSSLQFWKAISAHNSGPLHQAAYKNLKLRESQLKDSNIVGLNPKDVVKTNRALLALLMQILCSKKSQLHNTDSNFDGYEELMKVAISYEPELQLKFKKSFSENGLIDFVSRHAKKLLSSVKTKLSVRIFEEISTTPFVSVIYEDTVSVVDRSSQVAVIIRFVTEKGDISEKFLKFVKIGPSRNAYDILEVHLNLVEELDIRQKLVGYTFSGTVIAPSSIEEFMNIVSKQSPKANFFHHPDHDLKELLLQSLSHLEECQRFLEVISDLVKFLTNNSGAIPTLVTFIKHNKPNCQLLEDDRSFTIDIISTIRRYYPLIIDFFHKVSQKFWNDEVTKHAPIFTKFLQEPFNRFLIAVIATVLDEADDLCKVMGKDYDPAEWKSQSTNVLAHLTELRENGVEKFLFLESTKHDRLIDGGMQKYCPETFNKIIKTAMICVRHRAYKADKFYLNGSHSKVSDVLRAPESWHRYGFRCSTEKDFKEHLNFFNICILTFSGKSIPEMTKGISNMQLASKFGEWRSFLCFCALAISPNKSSPSTPSALLRLKSYLKDKERFEPTEALMFLEKALLGTELQTEDFIEEVITHYAKKNNQRNFLYNFSETTKSEIEKC